MVEVTPRDPLVTSHALQCLNEINRYLLNEAGEIITSPGKISLIWMDPLFEIRRYLAVKSSGADQVLINGKRCAATETDLKQGLIACLREMR